MLLVLQQVANFGKEFFLCRRLRLWLGLFLLLLGKLVDQFDQHEDTESHDEEVEAGLQEVAIVDGGSRQFLAGYFHGRK